MNETTKTTPKRIKRTRVPAAAKKDSPAKKATVRKSKPAEVAVTAVSGTKNVEFEYQGSPGQVVALAGSFNDWSHDANVMQDVENVGTYTCIVCLKPGSYEYKFIVDGQWLMDSGNQNFTPNDQGSLNSVIVVE